MSKFTIGDRVVVTNTDYDTEESPNLANGSKGEVIDVSPKGVLVSVRMDEGRRDDQSGNGWAFWPSQIQKEPQS